MGQAGTNWTHLHFEFVTGKPFQGTRDKCAKDPFAMTILKYIIPGFNDRGYFSVFNLPVFHK
jgi:hypothetical protein